MKISNELLADSAYNLEEHFVNQFVQAISATEENAFINGNADSDSSNQPTGFLTTILSSADSDSSIIKTSSSNDWASLLLKTVYALRRPYRKGACWLMNDSTLQYLRMVKDANERFLWTDSLKEGEPNQLIGYPVYTSEYFPKGESGEPVLAFGNFKKYIIADRGQRIFKPLRELFALNDLTAFVMLERVDGKLIDSDAIKLLFKND